MIKILRRWIERAHEFEKAAKQLLAPHESSPHRTITLEQTRKKLQGLTLQQNELFEQAVKCVDNNIHRAAHVMAWAAFMDYFEMRLDADKLEQLKTVRSNWSRYTDMEELREHIAEYQIIEAAYDIRFLKKTEKKSLLGLLSKRNECAHPSTYDPTRNQAIGYIDDLLNRIATLQQRS